MRDISAPEPARVRQVEVFMTRMFDAPRPLVFETWTKAEHFSRWFAPHGVDVVDCEVDARPGGELRFGHASAELGVLWVKGWYLEVVAPERLVFELGFVDEQGWPAPPHFCAEWPVESKLVTQADFIAHGKRTEIVLRQSLVPASAAALPSVAEVFRGAEEGWGQTLERLGTLLESL